MVCPPPQPAGQKEQEPQGLKPTETPRALPGCSSLRGPSRESFPGGPGSQVWGTSSPVLFPFLEECGAMHQPLFTPSSCTQAAKRGCSPSHRACVCACVRSLEEPIQSINLSGRIGSRVHIGLRREEGNPSALIPHLGQVHTTPSFLSVPASWALASASLGPLIRAELISC